MRCIRMLTSDLYMVALTRGVEYSFNNLQPITTMVPRGLQYFIENMERISSTYLVWVMKMSLDDFWTYMPKYYYMSPKSLISNSLTIAFLNCQSMEEEKLIKNNIINIETNNDIVTFIHLCVQCGFREAPLIAIMMEVVANLGILSMGACFSP